MYHSNVGPKVHEIFEAANAYFGKEEKWTVLSEERKLKEIADAGPNPVRKNDEGAK